MIGTQLIPLSRLRILILCWLSRMIQFSTFTIYVHRIPLGRSYVDFLVHRHRVKRPSVKRHRVKRQTVKNATKGKTTKGKNGKKYFKYYFRVRLG